MSDGRGASDSFIDPVGRKLYEEVMGRPLFDQQHPPPLDLLRELTVNHLFARIWSRSAESESGTAISLRERRLVTIALLAALGRIDQLEDHVAGAYRAGLMESELTDLMIHVAHYAGWPAGNIGQKTVRSHAPNPAA
jgi:4-carboxymuconolactone decarboxylase